MYEIIIMPIGLLLLIIYIIFDFFINRTNHLLKRVIFYSFIFYLLNVLELTTGSIHIPPDKYKSHRLQLIPFKFLLEWLELYKFSGADWWFWNSVKLSFYNLIMFFPLGIYFQILFKLKNMKKVFFYLILSSLTIEVYQFIFSYFGFVFRRTSNIDDIILNTLGGMIGYYIYKITFENKLYRK